MEKYLFAKILRKETLLVSTFSLTFVFGQYHSQKITATTRESRAEFGTSVAMTDQYAAVGASRENVATGAAYIYRKNGGSWNFHQKIEASDGAEMSEFGGSMKFGNDFLVVAAGRSDLGQIVRAGALYIYEPTADNDWAFTQKLTASDASGNALLGVNPTSLAVGENIIVAGAPGLDSWKGAVYIFEKQNGNWLETQKIEAPDIVYFGNFGIGVSISNNYLVIGASGENNNSGKIYIYKKNDTGAWALHQSLTSSDNYEYAYFGNAVSINDNDMVVGAYTEPNTGHPPMAYIFKLDGNGNWSETQKIQSYESSEHTYFAWMTEIRNDKLLITSPHIYGEEPGKAQLYKKNEQNNWELDQELIADNDVRQDFYGWSTAMTDNDILLGAPRDDLDSNEENELFDAGSAHIFSLSNLSTEESLAGNDVKIFPNPVKDFAMVTSKKAIASVTILDQSARSLSQSKSSRINASQLPKGIYLVKVEFVNGSSSVHKLIKQ